MSTEGTVRRDEGKPRGRAALAVAVAVAEAAPAAVVAAAPPLFSPGRELPGLNSECSRPAAAVAARAGRQGGKVADEM